MGAFTARPFSASSVDGARTSVIHTLVVHTRTIGHASKRPFARRYRSNDKRVYVVSAARERDKYVFAPSPNQLPTTRTAADVRLVSRENDGFSWNLTPVPTENPHTPSPLVYCFFHVPRGGGGRASDREFALFRKSPIVSARVHSDSSRAV